MAKKLKRETARQKRIRLLRKCIRERWLPRSKGKIGGGCALCAENWMCNACPVDRDSGNGCENTPFRAWAHAAWDDRSSVHRPRRATAIAAAKEELAYLRRLIRKEGAKP